ncbi:unnamed protein product [Oreochromis niloticus]|nr:unnamed protein product [Mustela putorius furo]
MEPTIGELERLIRDNCSLLESMAAETQRRRPELGRPEGHSAPRNSHPLLSPRPEGIPGAAPQLPGRTAAKLQHYTGATQLEPYLAQVTLAATHNGWGQEETATHLALALEGPALQVLLDLPLEEQRDLRALTTALGRRRLNAVTRKDSYPLPRIDDALDYIAGSSWFSSLDLRSGYWQVELAAEARPKTAFTIGQGLWQFRVMPFGLCNAPATFERRLEELDRGPTSAAAEPEGEDEGQEPFTAAELQQHQVSDPALGMVRDWMEAGTRPDWSAVSSQGPETKSLYSQWNNLELHGGWPEAYAVPDQSAVTTARTLVDEMFTRFGVPEELHSDQGRNFESQVLGEVCRRLGVRKTRTTPLHPQSDGLVERFNRTLATQLAILTSQHQGDWDQHLPLVLWAYRTAVQESSQCTPAALMFGRELRTPVDLVFGAPPEPEIAGGPEMDYFRRLRERLHTVHQLARRTLEGAGARQKRAYDTRAHGPMLGAGDRVWVFCPQRKRGLTPKLMSHWQGPGEILEQLSEVVFRVRMPGRGRRVVLHKDRLAPYHPLAPNPQTGVQPGDSLPPTPSPNGGAMDSQSRPKRTRRRPGHLLDYRVDS